MKMLKVLLCAFAMAIFAISLVFLLDTSYDWISSSSNAKVIAGAVILLLMTSAILAVIAAAVASITKGVKYLWTR